MVSTAGGSSPEDCQRECDKNQKCSGVEWYWNQANKCYLMDADVPAAMGHSGARWLEAMCFVKLSRERVKFRMKQNLNETADCCSEVGGGIVGGEKTRNAFFG